MDGNLTAETRLTTEVRQRGVHLNQDTGGGHHQEDLREEIAMEIAMEIVMTVDTMTDMMIGAVITGGHRLIITEVAGIEVHREVDDLERTGTSLHFDHTKRREIG